MEPTDRKSWAIASLKFIALFICGFIICAFVFSAMLIVGICQAIGRAVDESVEMFFDLVFNGTGDSPRNSRRTQ